MSLTAAGHASGSLEKLVGTGLLFGLVWHEGPAAHGGAQ